MKVGIKIGILNNIMLLLALLAREYKSRVLPKTLIFESCAATGRPSGTCSIYEASEAQASSKASDRLLNEAKLSRKFS